MAKYNKVYHLGPTENAVQHLWYAEQARLTKDPVGGQVGPDEWTDVFLPAGYYEQTWLQLGAVFADWENTHNAKPARIVALPAPTGPATTTASPCTTRCSAPTCSGR